MRKVIISIVTFLITIGVYSQISYAQVQSVSDRFAIKRLRGYSTPSAGYTIGTPDLGSVSSGRVLWDITKNSNEGNLYCVNPTKGFGIATDSSSDVYDKKIDLSIAEDVEEIKAENTVAAEFFNNSNYSKVLNVMDAFFVPSTITTNTNQQEAIDYQDTFLPEDDRPDSDSVYMQTDLIMALQQKFLWEKLYNTSPYNVDIYSVNKVLSEAYTDSSYYRDFATDNLTKLIARDFYNNLNAKYSSTTSNAQSKVEVTIQEKVQIKDVSGTDYFVLGPINVKRNGTVDVNLEVTKDNVAISNYYITNQAGVPYEGTTQSILTSNNGKDLYIRVSKEVGQYGIKVYGTKQVVKKYLYVKSDSTNYQPIVELVPGTQSFESSGTISSNAYFIYLNKVDQTGTFVPGAVIKAVSVANGNEVYRQITTPSSTFGQYTLTTPASLEYNMYEYTCPTGYVPTNYRFNVRVEFKEQDGKYIVDNDPTKTRIITYDTNDNVVSSDLMTMTIDNDNNCLTLTLKNEKEDIPTEFDLALRKYITKVTHAGVATNITNRVPNIENDAINTNGTANYKHRKDPLEVTAGDFVTYTLTIYNEGDELGYAKEIKDQLPDYLTFSSINSTYYDASYDEETNVVTLTAKDSIRPLNGYTNGQVADSMSCEIVCEVASDAPVNNVLTNVAYISKAQNTTKNIEVTTTDDERDSLPSSHPTNDKSNLTDYKGSTTNKDVTPADSTYYYKGLEDDDDFEKVIVKQEQFDLSLRKYISQINNVTLTNSRIPNIDVSNLLDGSQTTATYYHPKSPLTVEQGQEIIYNIRVYNEGKVDGRANKIIDQIPEELEFVEVVSGPYTASYNSGTNIVTFTRTNQENLSKFVNRTTLDYETLTYKVKVADNATRGIKTNVAWISEQVNGQTNEIITNQEYETNKGADIDSQPSNSPDVNKSNMTDYKGSSTNKDVTPEDSNYYYKGLQDDDDFEKVQVVIEDKFNISIIKKNQSGSVMPDVVFTVNGQDKTTNSSGILEVEKNKQILNANQTDSYIITEKTVPDGYEKYNGTITIELKYKLNTQNRYEIDEQNTSVNITQNQDNLVTYDISNNNVIFTIVNLAQTQDEEFDLKLIKNITQKNGIDVPQRLLDIDVSNLNTVGGAKTATYTMSKAPVNVSVGDIITYRLRVYNEGQIDGYASQIKDSIPNGLKFISEETIDDADITDDITSAINFNKGYGWVLNQDGSIQTDYLSKENETVVGENLIQAFGDNDGTKTKADLKYKEVFVKLLVEKQMTTQIINDAQITKEEDPDGNDIEDRDSDPDDFVGYEDDEDYDIIEQALPFDLKLIKNIVKVNNNEVSERLENIDVSNLNTENGTTTATYSMTKVPVSVKIGDVVTYRIRVYNEGLADGYASQITEDIPSYLKFPVSGSNLTTTEQEVLNFNNYYGWTKTNNTVSTSYLSKENEQSSEANLIKAFGINNGTKTKTDLDYKEVFIQLIVSDYTENTIRNEAAITQNTNANGNEVSDRDSDTNTWKKYEDDEDYDLIAQEMPFDLKLIKNITQVNRENVTERLKEIDVSSLNTINGQSTATYSMVKDPISIKNGDIVTFRIRVYNEGFKDGYATKITEDIPDGLEFIENGQSQEELDAIEFNQNYGWTKQNNTIYTTYLEDQLIQAFGFNDGTKTLQDLKYKEVFIKLKVIATSGLIRNEAEISDHSLIREQDVEDRDSDPSIWKKYEDDEDYDTLILDSSYDLSLRKWIMGVSSVDEFTKDTNLVDENKKFLKEPVVDTSQLNKIDEKYNLTTTATYNHPKDPVVVTIGDYVLYTIRVYNEGSQKAYASEIEDYLPEYLEYVDNDFNKSYGWVADGRKIRTTILKNKLIDGAKSLDDGTYSLSYEEVGIILRVSKTTPDNSILTNIAQITKFEDENNKQVEDRDSKPDNLNYPKDSELPTYKEDDTSKYVPGQEDDDDFDKVIVKIFDLSLYKWVTEVSVKTSTGTQVIQTNYTPYDNPDKIAKVDLKKNDITTTQVKFKYSIRIVNEGSIAGTATKITDTIPDGLKFNQEDNPLWTQVATNQVETSALQDTILNPGDYADISIILEWIPNSNNLGLKVNWAEITEDYNKYGIQDKDSTPKNGIKTEDDIDYAQVLLTVATGGKTFIKFISFTTVILIIFGLGILIIKKVNNY